MKKMNTNFYLAIRNITNNQVEFLSSAKNKTELFDISQVDYLTTQFSSETEFIKTLINRGYLKPDQEYDCYLVQAIMFFDNTNEKQWKLNIIDLNYNDNFNEMACLRYFAAFRKKRYAKKGKLELQSPLRDFKTLFNQIYEYLLNTFFNSPIFANRIYQKNTAMPENFRQTLANCLGIDEIAEANQQELWKLLKDYVNMRACLQELYYLNHGYPVINEEQQESRLHASYPGILFKKENFLHYSLKQVNTNQTNSKKQVIPSRDDLLQMYNEMGNEEFLQYMNNIYGIHSIDYCNIFAAPSDDDNQPKL